MKGQAAAHAAVPTELGGIIAPVIAASFFGRFFPPSTLDSKFRDMSMGPKPCQGLIFATSSCASTESLHRKPHLGRDDSTVWALMCADEAVLRRSTL